MYPGNAYCQTCSEAMTRRAQELEAAAETKAAKPRQEQSNLLRAVAYVTIIGAVVSISPYLFFRAQEKVNGASKAFSDMTDTRSAGQANALADKSKGTLSIGKAQRTASLDAAMRTGIDQDPAAGQPTSTDSTDQVNHFPQTVSDWVGGLKQFEKERETLALSQLRVLGETVGDDRSKMGDQFEDEWIQLLRRFEKEEAPLPCQDLAAAYSRTLRETANVLVNRIRGSEKPSLASDAAVTVLVAPAQDADQLLNKLCNRYGSSKDFAITAQLRQQKQL